MLTLAARHIRASKPFPSHIQFFVGYKEIALPRLLAVAKATWFKESPTAKVGAYRPIRVG